MEELKKAFYDVMYKYQKEFGETGVTAILNEWAKNKAALLELLRRHPDWREQEKAVVLEYDEGRGIEHDSIDEIAYTLLEMAREMLSGAELDQFCDAFRASIIGYSSTVSEENLAIIRDRGGIKCATGQNASRIIGKLCRKFRVDTHQRYNAVFAQLADALNPLQMKKTAILSLHPCDFLEMSNKDNTWRSCHRLNGGEYQAGAISYMLDEVSMIFFTVDSDVKEHFHKAPRRGRQMFFYQNNMLFQSRQYPKDANDLMEQYRNIVQKVISVCLGVPNRWQLKNKRTELDEFYTTDSHGLHYPDYEYFGNISLLRGAENYGILHIGHPALCVCCGHEYNSHSQLKCNHCEATVVCKDCGKTVALQNARYIDDAYHCNTCMHVCADCGMVITNGVMYPALDRRGNLVEVCESCFQHMQEPCHGCSVRAICRVIGNSLCHKTSFQPAEQVQ